MEEALRGGAAIAPDYPLVFSPQGSGEVIVASEGAEVLSTCALLERDLLYPGGSIRVGLIGSVSTAEHARGRGLASAVLEHAEGVLRQRGCLFALLWADAPEFYIYRGYGALGSERDYALTTSLVQGLPSSEFVRVATADDHETLHELYQTQELRVGRSAVESAMLYRTPGMQVLVAAPEGVPAAYLCQGRGGDLQGVVHEWAGAPQGVLSCLRSLLEHRRAVGDESPLFLMSPDVPNAVTAHLDRLSAPNAPGALGMGKLLDCERAAESVALASTEPLEWELQASGSCLLRVGTHRAELTPESLASLLMPARGDRSWIRSVESKLATRLVGLPWDSFLWGLDSI